MTFPRKEFREWANAHPATLLNLLSIIEDYKDLEPEAFSGVLPEQFILTRVRELEAHHQFPHEPLREGLIFGKEIVSTTAAD